MIETVKVRNIVIGEGLPKICVPAACGTKEEILREAGVLRELGADIAEFRADIFESAADSGRVVEVLAGLREGLKDMPLLMTLRTSDEGGEFSAGEEAYADINIAAVRSGYIDMVDVEAFRSDGTIKAIIDEAHAAGVKVIASNHDFSATPEREEIKERLCRMQRTGADIVKIAVMPRCFGDVIGLLTAVREMPAEHPEFTCPVVAVSMSDMGMISRAAGELFGSAITFGSATKASAPGQIPADELKRALLLVHDALQE